MNPKFFTKAAARVHPAGDELDKPARDKLYEAPAAFQLKQRKEDAKANSPEPRQEAVSPTKAKALPPINTAKPIPVKASSPGLNAVWSCS
jgi:hypothetical protein